MNFSYTKLRVGILSVNWVIWEAGYFYSLNLLQTYTDNKKCFNLDFVSNKICYNEKYEDTGDLSMIHNISVFLSNYEHFYFLIQSNLLVLF